MEDTRGVSLRRLTILFWMGAILTVVVMAWATPVGWDAQVCWSAIQSVHHNSDPYAEGILALRDFHSRLASNPAERPPLVYVYSPLTLPLLRMLGMFPGWLLIPLYWAAVVSGGLLQLWSGFQMANEAERPWLALLLPAVTFFPGLVTDDVFLSGNVAYILYGVIFAAAIPGWKRGTWFWYYVAVLAASVCKAPFLALLAFPALVDRDRWQWVRSGIAAAVGVLIFVAQLLIWPGLFREYLLTLRLMFDWAHDFGFGPAGIMGRALWGWELPSSSATAVLYMLLAGVLALVLLFLAHRVREWDLPRATWIPAALVGTVLLNPRIMKYDLAAITIPMLLIGWRGLRLVAASAVDESEPGIAREMARKRSRLGFIVAAAAFFLIPNIVTVAGPTWFPVELLVLLAVFGMGVWSLYQSPVQVQVLFVPARLGSDYAAEYPAEVLVGQEP
jgi:hypothetical protein